MPNERAEYAVERRRDSWAQPMKTRTAVVDMDFSIARHPGSLLVAFVVAATAFSAPAHAQSPNATLPSNCTDQVIAPERVLLTCADGNFYADGLLWSNWGAEQSTATGTAHVNNCAPSCAEGEFETYPILLNADQSTVCQFGDPQYTRVSYAFPESSPFPPDAPGTLEPVVNLPCPREPHPDPRIRDMRLRLTGHRSGADYFVRVHLKLRVCAVHGPARVVVNETKRAGGYIFGRHTRTLNFKQTRACNTRFFPWRLRDEFFGVGTYKVAATVWDKDFQASRTVSRKKVTLD